MSHFKLAKRFQPMRPWEESVTSEAETSPVKGEDINGNQTKLKIPKSFPCTLCKYISSNETNLVRHTRKHTGEKPFGCHICDKRFARTDHLKSHLQTHGRLLPFYCKICRRQFSLKHKKDAHENNCQALGFKHQRNFKTPQFVKFTNHSVKHNSEKIRSK